MQLAAYPRTFAGVMLELEMVETPFTPGPLSRQRSMQGKRNWKSVRIRHKGVKINSHPRRWPLDMGEQSMAMDPS